VTAAISVEKFTKKYGDHLAVDAVSFEVRAGEVFALLGPNGAGKSTLVRAIVGIHDATSGSIRVAGRDVAAEPVQAKENLGYVPETSQLYEALTASEYLTLAARLHGLPDSESKNTIAGLLESLDLRSAAGDPLATFSKGMKQKVAIAAALLPDPPILILDEPLSGLDAETGLVLRSLVCEFAQRGRTVLYTSHLLDVVEKLADRVAILVAGKIAAIGTLEEIRAQAGTGGDLASVFSQLTRTEDPLARARSLLDRAKRPAR
jgi:ABC-2 type transport system ATP-binding protein